MSIPAAIAAPQIIKGNGGGDSKNVSQNNSADANAGSDSDIGMNVTAAKVDGFSSQQEAKAYAALRKASQTNVRRDPKELARVSQPIDDEVVMYAGEARVFDVGDVNRIAIGNGKIASTAVIEKTKMLIIAQEVGLTNILIWKKPNLVREIKLRVTALNIIKQQRDIQLALADMPEVQVVRRGERLYIEGVIHSRELFARIASLTSQYANLINNATLDAGNGVPDYKKDQQMLVFDLYFVEFKKSFVQNLGVAWAKSFNGFNVGVFGEASRGNPYIRALPATGGNGAATYTLPDDKIHGVSASVNALIAIPSIINAAVSTGDAYVLASPSISTKNGGSAKFLAGGEVPIPTVSQNGTNVTFKQYGILIEIQPTLDSFNNITGTLKMEVSAVDTSVAVSGIPGFSTRRTETDFSVKTGDALVLSGLYSQNGSRSGDKVPGLGDIPILGNLFKENDTTRSDDEIYLIAVPHTMDSENADDSNALRNVKAQLNSARVRVGDPEQGDLFSLRNVQRPQLAPPPMPVQPPVMVPAPAAPDDAFYGH